MKEDMKVMDPFKDNITLKDNVRVRAIIQEMFNMTVNNKSTYDKVETNGGMIMVCARPTEIKGTFPKDKLLLIWNINTMAESDQLESFKNVLQLIYRTLKIAKGKDFTNDFFNDIIADKALATHRVYNPVEKEYKI